jgi:hypothetical protein
LRRNHNVLLSSRTAGDPRSSFTASFQILNQKMWISRCFLCVHKCNNHGHVKSYWQKSWGGSVGIATDCWQDERDSISGREIFLHSTASSLSLRPTQSPI